jgi:hypothetical protein
VVEGDRLVIRQLSAPETNEALAEIERKKFLWSEHGAKLELCKVGEGIEVFVPEGKQLVTCINGVRSNARLRGIAVQVHADRRTRRIVFKRID